MGELGDPRDRTTSRFAEETGTGEQKSVEEVLLTIRMKTRA